MRICPLCGETVTPSDPTTYRLTHGWTRKRDGGGVHAIRLPKYEEVWAHKLCVDREVSGVGAKQGSLV